MLLYRMESEKIKSFEILLPDGPLNYELVTSYKLDSEKEFTITLPKKNTHPDEEHKDFNEYDDDSWDKCPCNSEDEEYKRA